METNFPEYTLLTMLTNSPVPPSVMLQSSFLVNSLYEGVRRPGMTLAGMALLGAGGRGRVTRVASYNAVLRLPLPQQHHRPPRPHLPHQAARAAHGEGNIIEIKGWRKEV